MKKITLSLGILLFVTSTILAQAPQSFKYQAIARDAEGNIISSKQISLMVNLLQGSKSGKVVFSETHKLQTSDFGLILLEIGKGKNKSGDFSSIDWGNDNYYVSIDIDINGGTDFVSMGTSQLLSVPYALYSASSGSSSKEANSWTDGANVTYLTNSGWNVGIGTSAPSSKLDVIGKGTFENVYGSLTDVTTASGHLVSNKLEVLYEPASSSAVKGSSLQIKAVTADPGITNFTSFLQGLRFSLIHRNDGTISQLIGGRFQMGMPTGTWGGTGTNGAITSMKGIDMELYGMKGTVTYGTGISLETVGSNFTNLTYLRINQPTDVAGNYGIYNNSTYDNYFAGNVGVGTTSPDNSAIVEMQSTTQGLLPPRLTTTQMNAVPNPATGLCVYNTEVNAVCYYNGSSWDCMDIQSLQEKSFVCGNSFQDYRDSIIYKSVPIGTQCWMAENLAYLPAVYPSDSGSNTSSYYYVYGYDGTIIDSAKATSNYQTYGVLYNWLAAIAGAASSNSVPSGVQGVCPAGWHLPSDAEWTVLTDYLGGLNAAGGKIKEAGTTHWVSPNTGATNSSSFTALPGGYRKDDGLFNYFGSNGYFWSSSESNISNAWFRYLLFNYPPVYRSSGYKEYGFSVRCCKD